MFKQVTQSNESKWKIYRLVILLFLFYFYSNPTFMTKRNKFGFRWNTLLINSHWATCYSATPCWWMSAWWPFPPGLQSSHSLTNGKTWRITAQQGFKMSQLSDANTIRENFIGYMTWSSSWLLRLNLPERNVQCSFPRPWMAARVKM